MKNATVKVEPTQDLKPAQNWLQQLEITEKEKDLELCIKTKHSIHWNSNLIIYTRKISLAVSSLFLFVFILLLFFSLFLLLLSF